MADDVKISSPVKIEPSSKERVAFDLLEKISTYDSRFETESNDRKYWLTFYWQCLKASSGYSLESTLKEE